MNPTKAMHTAQGMFSTIAILLALSVTAAGQNRPIELADMFRVKRVSDPQISPDGKWVAYVVGVVDKDANRVNTDIWTIAIGGGEAKMLTNSPRHDRHPRWSPDSKHIVFESNRGGSYQIYTMASDGSGSKQLTTISTEATGADWSLDGKNIAFVSAVYPEFSEKPFSESDALNKKKDEQRENSKVKARIMTRLLYRHWDSWVDDKRQHIFIVPASGGRPKDLTPGDRDAVPTSSTFSAGDDFDISPDGKELAYTATPMPAGEEAWSTNHDIYTVKIATGERKQLTTNPAADTYPRYSRDGKHIAYRAQKRPGFEADRWQLMVLDRATGTSQSLTPKFDANVDAMAWTQAGNNLFFPSEEKGHAPVWTVSLRGNDERKIIEDGVNGDVSVSSNGKLLVFTRQSLTRAIEIYTATTDGKKMSQLTHVNDALFSEFRLQAPEYVWYTGAEGDRVQMWIVKPPGFNQSKKYPLVFWVHGGPQSAFMNSWSYRWNPELWAAQGYVLALPNPRGSIGFGQDFTDAISHDWGGKAYEDVMKGVDYMEDQPYIDATRMAAAGASYGGYMMNWINGHSDKFKTIICHDGVFNFYSMYGTTEEVWFDEWEHGIPWKTSDFDKFSPHKFAANMKTPTLIIHSELDYRVPLTEGQQLFTTLQRKGIDSKLLYFPDEGHWVLKPQNSELWHKTVFGWLDGYLKK